MLSGLGSKVEAPEDQRRPTTATAPATSDGGISSDAIPLALLAQHQSHVPAPTCSEQGRERADAAARHHHAEGVGGMGQCSSAVTAAAAAARRGGDPSPVSASSDCGVPPEPRRVQEQAQVEQSTRNATGESKAPRQSAARQMGTGVLNNALGVWAASGISVSESRASKVDETVDVGAQANPSGVYPVVQPLAYLPGRHRPLSPPSSSASHRRATGVAACATKPMPVRTHPFGPGLQYLHHAQVYPRPFSAPAGAFSSPVMRPVAHHAGGTATQPPLPPEAGLKRASARGKGGSVATGSGLSKAAVRSAARAKTAASVISAVADSKTVEARRAAAAAAAAAAAIAAAAAAASGSAEPDMGGESTQLKRSRSKREHDTHQGGGGCGETTRSEIETSRRPATAPAAFSSASLTTASTADIDASKTALDDPTRLHSREQQHLQHPTSFSQRLALSAYPAAPWGTGGDAISAMMPMPMAAAHWAHPWAHRTSSRAAEGCSVASQLPRIQPPERRQRGSGVGSSLDRAIGEPVAAAMTAVADAAPGGGVHDKREPPAAAAAAAAAEAATAANAASSSSPDPEDIYADSWLTGLPWATSSPPNLDGLEVESPRSPTPLDALRSDDRGTRGSDGEEEPVLFMNHHQAPLPMPVLQEATDAVGGGGTGIGQHGALLHDDQNAAEVAEPTRLIKDRAAGKARESAAVQGGAAVKRAAPPSPPTSRVENTRHMDEGEGDHVQPAAFPKRGRTSELVDLPRLPPLATGAPPAVGQAHAFTRSFVSCDSQPSRSPSPLAPPPSPRRSPRAKPTAQGAPPRTPRASARVSVLPLPPQPQQQQRRISPSLPQTRSAPSAQAQTIERQPTLLAGGLAELPTPPTPSLPDWALLPPPLSGLDPTSAITSPPSSPHARSNQTSAAGVPTSDVAEGVGAPLVAHDATGTTDDNAAARVVSARATRQARSSSSTSVEPARTPSATAGLASLRQRGSAPPISAPAATATLPRRGAQTTSTEGGMPRGRTRAAAVSTVSTVETRVGAAGAAGAAAAVAATGVEVARAATGAAAGPARTRARTREADTEGATKTATVRGSDASGTRPPAAGCQATIGAMGSNVDGKPSSSLSPPSTSDRSAVVQRDWICTSPGCTNPAYFERREELPRPTAKRRRGAVDRVSTGSMSAATVEGGELTRRSSSTSDSDTGDRTSSVREAGAPERWCAAHQPEGSELSRRSVCSSPGCRLMWTWGYKPTTGSRERVENQESLPRYCTRHKQDGTCRLREETMTLDEEQGCDDADRVTTTRRSKRRRSSGGVPE